MTATKLKSAIAASLLVGGGLILAGRAATPGDSGTNNAVATTNAATTAAKLPKSPVEFFNFGTSNLASNKLDEAEVLFQRALESQKDSLTGPSLYNLGHVRFGQGAEELKKTPGAKPLSNRTHQLADAGADAIRQIDESMASENVQKMVQAYVNGRGVRKNIKDATKAVGHAMEVHGKALGKWQRSSGDFKSAAELNKSDADSAFNADVVDRNIARLIDSIREMKQNANAMSEQGKQLSEKMKQLKGKIPASEMPPGASGDEDEDDQPLGQKPDQQEAPGKEGKEIPLSPELAGWLLEGFRLDSDRRLPMSQKQGEPRQHSGPTW